MQQYKQKRIQMPTLLEPSARCHLHSYYCMYNTVWGRA
jgi:hypothetical protein